MSDLFESVANKYRNSPSALVLFLASVSMLVIGINHFAEDTYSSYAGLISIEQHFNLNVQVWDWTYWTMSITPQIAGIVFFYIYLANTNKGWALWASGLSQLVDFSSDLWYRSNGAVFTEWGATGVSALITLAFFTIGSEVFTTIGAGLVLKLAAPALHAWKYYVGEVKNVKNRFSGSSDGGEWRRGDGDGGHRGGSQRGGQHKTKHREPVISDELRKRLQPKPQAFQNLHGIKSEKPDENEEDLRFLG